MKPQPIETVVIRPPRLALPAPARDDAAWDEAASPVPPSPEPPASEPPSPEPTAPPDWSPAQMREQVALAEMSKCPVRMRILLALASGGRVHIGERRGKTCGGE